MNEKTREILSVIETISLTELAPVFELLAKRVTTNRSINNGYVPIEIFRSCIEIGGVYPCVEVAVRRIGTGTFFVKKRKSHEDGWYGLFQITGVAGRKGDNPSSIIERIAHEIYGAIYGAKYNNIPPLLPDGLLMAGIEIHSEPERGADCWTLVYILNIHDPSCLDGEWIEVSGNADIEHDDRIVGHQRQTLKWLANSNRPLFVRLQL